MASKRWKEMTPSIMPYCKTFKWGDCRVFVGQEPGIGWHLSMSQPYRYPTWDEIKSARYELLPHDVTMAMILPPTDEYVNFHPNCFHLHQIPNNDEEKR